MRKTLIIAIITAVIGFGNVSCITPRPPHKPHPEHVGPKPPKKKKPKHPKPPKRERPPHEGWH